MKEILKKLLLFFNVPQTVRAEPGETELDYLPKNEIIKRKRNPKQFDGLKNEQSFVKNRKTNK